jgi:hypothetical protein
MSWTLSTEIFFFIEGGQIIHGKVKLKNLIAE